MKISQLENGVIHFCLKFSNTFKSYKYHPEIGIEELDFLQKKHIKKLYAKGDHIWIQYSHFWEKYNIKTGQQLIKYDVNGDYQNVREIPNTDTERDFFVGVKEGHLTIIELFENGLEELVRVPIQNNKATIPKIRAYYHSANDLFIIYFPNQLLSYSLKDKKIASFQLLENQPVPAFLRVLLIDNKDIIWVRNEKDIFPC